MLEERIFINWLKKNKLLGPINKNNQLGLLLSIDMIIQEYNGGMLLTRQIFRRILRDWQIASFGDKIRV